MGLRRKEKTASKRMSAAQKRKFIALAGLVFLCAVFIVGIFYSSVYRYVHRMDKDQIEQNVFVQGIDVSGLTKKQAIAQIEGRWTVLRNTPMTLKAGDKTAKVTLSELGIRQGDVEKLADQAVAYGKRGNLYQRYRKIRKAKKEKVEYETGYEIEEEQAKSVLKEKTVDFFEGAVNASITRVGGVFQIIGEKDGETADTEDLLDRIRDELDDLEAGREIELEVSSMKEEPKISRKDLEKIQVEKGSSTIKVKRDDRKQELLPLTTALNGQVVMPEKKLSLQSVLEKFLRDGTPGEALQMMASCLYESAKDAGIVISEFHKPQSLGSGQKDGLTVRFDREQDLEIENKTEAPLYIESYINGEGELVCTIYGAAANDEEKDE